jgi:hypothetical protein
MFSNDYCLLKLFFFTIFWHVERRNEKDQWWFNYEQIIERTLMQIKEEDRPSPLRKIDGVTYISEKELFILLIENKSFYQEKFNSRLASCFMEHMMCTHIF